MSNAVFTVKGHTVVFDRTHAFVDGLFTVPYHNTPDVDHYSAEVMVMLYEDWIKAWDMVQELPDEDNPNIVPGKYKEVVKLLRTEDHLGNEEEGSEAS